MIITILTDHSSHTKMNSFYGMCNALQNHNKVSGVQVASKGNSLNNDFFNNVEGSILYGSRLSENIAFPADSIFEKTEELDLETSEVLFLRVPPPFKSSLIDRINLLDYPLVINDPDGIEITADKSFLLNFEDYTPPMSICKSFNDIYNFYMEQECVLKPLSSYGGKGIVRIHKGHAYTANGNMTLDEFQEEYYENPTQYLAMKFLKNVTNGDKRIVVADGEILCASLRFPAKGKWLCNVAQGGRDEISEPTEREREIVDYITPILMEEGIFYYGLDTIEDDDGERIISEINTMSPGGLTPAEIKSGKEINKRFSELLVYYCENLI